MIQKRTFFTDLYDVMEKSFFAACETLLLAFIALALAGCALLGSNDDPVLKNPSIRFNAPSSPYKKVNVSSADAVWQSEKTGNTIAVNSMCQKYVDVSLKDLKQNILSGIENLKITHDRQTNFDGRDANRVLADGRMDGVPIRIDLLVYKKNNCTYDLAYIAKTNSFNSEQKIFEEFLTRFHVP